MRIQVSPCWHLARARARARDAGDSAHASGYRAHLLAQPNEPEDFYDSFVNPAKKRYNIASNVDVLEYGENTPRFRFKHWIFFDEPLSLVGDNECTMVRDGDRCYIASAYIRAIHANTQHAY